MNTMLPEVLEERKKFITQNTKCNSGENSFKCESDSVAGSVSQRACVYCGARVVLNPITDAVHIVHGPIGCASYTWDIRGSLTSKGEVFRNSFSTDLRETDIIFGGEKKLEGAIGEIAVKYSPKLIFVYATCVVGVIGDDIDSVCSRMEEKYGIRIIPVKSSGFAGTKAKGYKLACEALLKIMRDSKTDKLQGVNILGEFNLAGEIWVIKEYLNRLGIRVIAKITGDSSFEEIKEAPRAMLNIVQCAGTTTQLAKEMESRYGIPFIKVRFLGTEDTAAALLQIAELIGGSKLMEKAKGIIAEEEAKVKPILEYYRTRLEGKRAAMHVGGTYKVISLIKQFNELGIKTVICGTQTGNAEDYKVIEELADEEVVIVHDTNPAELEKFIREKKADILVGGVKERLLAYKLGIAFCDHNHERKLPLTGYVGAINFAKEIDLTINSPVWKYTSKDFDEISTVAQEFSVIEEPG